MRSLVDVLVPDCAHRGALEAGRTVAVLGCGAGVAYPRAHRSLWQRVCEEGLVLSELPPGTGAWRWTFPARNRISRDVGAVPGPVTVRTSAGPNELLAGGACLVRDAQDVLDAMLGPGARRVEREKAPDPYEVRRCAEAVIAEDRVPTDVLRDLISTYGTKETTPCD